MDGYCNLGLLYNEMNHNQRTAVVLLEEALALANLTGETARIGSFLVNMGISYQYADQFDEALRCLKQAENIFRRGDKPTGISAYMGKHG